MAFWHTICWLVDVQQMPRRWPTWGSGVQGAQVFLPVPLLDTFLARAIVQLVIFYCFGGPSTSLIQKPY
jgi:hypothetical protein